MSVSCRVSAAFLLVGCAGLRKPSDSLAVLGPAGLDMTALYLDTLGDALTGTLLRSDSVHFKAGGSGELERLPFDPTERARGTWWCEGCVTMIGGRRLRHLRAILEETITQGIPGDFLEAGVWRGGASIMARAVQRALSPERRVYACDSFSGLPDATQGHDVRGLDQLAFLKVSESEVRRNFESFRMLDDNVHFVKGYFAHSLPLLRQELRGQLAVLRGDGDMYESYFDILFNLYEFVPVGGYFICDDCPLVPMVEQAVQDFRRLHGITDEIMSVQDRSEGTGTFWKKSSMTPVDYGYYLKWNATRTFRDSP